VISTLKAKFQGVSAIVCFDVEIIQTASIIIETKSGIIQLPNFFFQL